MPVFDVTRRNMRQQLSRGYNDLIAVSGSLADPTTVQFFSPVFVFGENNNMLGAEVSFYGGGGASIPDGQRYINAVTAYSSASPSLYGAITVLQPWSAAPSTNSGWEIHKLFTRQQYEDAITSAIRKVARRSLTPLEEYSVAGAGIRNPAVDVWLSGTAVAPTGWTLNGTNAAVAQETTIVYRGARRSAALTNGTSQSANLTATTLNLAQYAGKTIRVKASVDATTSGRVFIRFNDGSTNTDSGNHSGTSGGDGNGTWRELDTGEITVPTGATAATVSLQISSGAQITARLAKMWIESEDQWAYPLEARWAFMQNIEIEDLAEDWTPIPGEFWFINKDRAIREMVFVRDYYTPSAGALIRMTGQQYPTDPTEEENLPVDPEYVLARAAADLFREIPAELHDQYATKLNAWEATAQRLELQTATKPYINSRPVEDV